MLNIFKKEKKNGIGQVYIFIGRSGCGKGTQVKFFMDKLRENNGAKVLHIETGSLFREFIKGQTYTEILSKQTVESGGLMPGALAIERWSDYLINNYTGKEYLIFDGAPRIVQESVLLDGILKFYGIEKYNVIYINVSKKWSHNRLFARGRKDDTEEGIAKRMNWFDEDVMPCIEYFKNNKNCEFIDVNGEQTIEEVHGELVKKVFNE